MGPRPISAPGLHICKLQKSKEVRAGSRPTSIAIFGYSARIEKALTCQDPFREMLPDLSPMFLEKAAMKGHRRSL